MGKTTTSVNLAASLAIEGKRTLLVDVDPQGNSTTGLGVDRAQLTLSLYDVLAGKCLLGEVLRQTEIPQLLLIPSTKDLIGAEIELVAAERREFWLKDAVTPLRELYDYILLDSAPSLGLLTLNALTAADSLLVPIQSEYYALEGLSALLETMRLVQKDLNPESAARRYCDYDVRRPQSAFPSGRRGNPRAFSRQALPHNHSAQRTIKRISELRQAGLLIRSNIDGSARLF